MIMNWKKYHPKYSFSMRISLAVLLIVTVLLGVVMSICFFLSKEATSQEAMARGRSELRSANAEIEKILVSVSSTVDGMRGAVLHCLQSPDTMYSIAYDVLMSNPNIVSSTIAFEPNFFSEKGYFYAPTTMWFGDTLKRKQLGTQTYRYHQMEWYAIPFQTKRPYWCEPYYDRGGNDYLEVTYSSPIELDGRVIGIITADVTLDRLTEIVNRIHVYPHSYNFMLSRKGIYLTHPDKNRVMSRSIFSDANDLTDTIVGRIGEEMTSGKSGAAEFRGSYGDSFVLFEPLGRIGWSTAIICSKDDVFANAHRLGRILVIVLVLGMLLLIFVCYKVVRLYCAPLKIISASAENVAMGNFETRLPKIRSRDELYRLRSMMVYMQKSLVNYMNKLQEMTANKERIESELRIAHNIQMYMIPRIFPPFPDRTDIDIYAMLRPAKEVGGDFYDFQIEDDHLYFIVGDVAGKGVPASLVMAVARTLFRIIAPREKEVVRVVEALNDAMVDGNESRLFITLFVGDLDLRTGNLEYCNAGHNPPIVRFGDTHHTQYLEVLPNLPVGALRNMDFKKQNITLPKNSVLFLYTDGLTEAENGSQEQYGEERLMALAKSKEEVPDDAETIVNNVFEAVERHVDGAEQSDDLTLLVIRNP